jgi:hypothetical protein
VEIWLNPDERDYGHGEKKCHRETDDKGIKQELSRDIWQPIIVPLSVRIEDLRKASS